MLSILYVVVLLCIFSSLPTVAVSGRCVPVEVKSSCHDNNNK